MTMQEKEDMKLRLESYRKAFDKFANAQSIDKELFFDKFYYWQIFQSILKHYDEYGQMTKKQYETLSRHIHNHLRKDTIPFVVFDRGYNRKDSNKGVNQHHLWLNDAKKVITYDLPLKDGYRGNMEVFEIKGTQCIVSFNKDKSYKIACPEWLLETGRYNIIFNRTKHKGFIRLT